METKSEDAMNVDAVKDSPLWNYYIAMSGTNLEEKTMEKLAKNYQVDGDHYTKQKIQPWDIIDTWPVEQQIGFHRGNVLKYLLRMFDKDTPKSNADKAAHYLMKLQEAMEK